MIIIHGQHLRTQNPKTSEYSFPHGHLNYYDNDDNNRSNSTHASKIRVCGKDSIPLIVIL